MSQYASPAELLESERDLVSLPDVLFRLQAAIDDPRSTAETIGAIIACDPALTARLLRLANSPVYGFGGRIDTISRAVTLVGMEPLYHLALATCAVSAFRNLPVQLINMDEFWVQSVYCAVVARSLAREAKVLYPERLFVAGLLHAIGALLIYLKCPDPAREILLASQGKRQLVPLLEKDLLGFTYAEVGAEIARRWNMPAWLEEAIGCHLNPETASRYPLETALVHLADRLTDVLVQGDAVEDVLADIPEEIRALTRLREGQILGVMSEVYSEFTEIAVAFLSV
ncbi:HDOD domain-containing protein [Methylothermus subterraneus]|nr:metal dependent phosphohydrolase [uncultured Gammaproteobacteria bacterium]